MVSNVTENGRQAAVISDIPVGVLDGAQIETPGIGNEGSRRIPVPAGLNSVVLHNNDILHLNIGGRIEFHNGSASIYESLAIKPAVIINESTRSNRDGRRGVPVDAMGGARLTVERETIPGGATAPRRVTRPR